MSSKVYMKGRLGLNTSRCSGNSVILLPNIGYKARLPEWCNIGSLFANKQPSNP